jgi:hypothetical protein
MIKLRSPAHNHDLSDQQPDCGETDPEDRVNGVKIVHVPWPFQASERGTG